jgi:hypothetical protein
VTSPLPRTIRFGVGSAARREAVSVAERMRAADIAARALFKVEHGGWVVVVYGKLRPNRPRQMCRDGPVMITAVIGDER